MNLKPRIQPLKPRHKFAALGVVAVAMVATPLVQVLRYQAAEIEAALHEQAGLDPLSGAVTLQHALLAHRDIAGLVLRGVLQLEPERSVRQAEVDDRSAALEATLDTLKLPRAASEAQALRQDWATLVPQVEQRTISDVDSAVAHRLLIEQTLQVIDLVAAASGLDTAGPGKIYLASVRDLAPLAQLPAQIATLNLAAGGGTERAGLVLAEAALARALGHLSQGLKDGALADPVLAGAVAAAGATADRLLQLHRQASPADATALAAAAATAQRAQATLFAAASTHVRGALVARAVHAQRQRAELLALMAALAALALGLALAVQRHLAPVGPEGTPPPGAGFDEEPDGQTLHRDVTGHLWQRLRTDSPVHPLRSAAPGAPLNTPHQDKNP